MFTPSCNSKYCPRRSLLIFVCSLLTALNLFLFLDPSPPPSLPDGCDSSAIDEYLSKDHPQSPNILGNKFMRSDLSLHWHTPIPAREKYPLLHNKYVTAPENCEGLGNQMWRFASLYAIARRTNRHIFFRSTDHCMRIYERELSIVFPELYKQIYFIDADGVEEIDFGVNCCTYKRPEELANFSTTAKYISTRDMYLQNYEFFHPSLRSDIRRLFSFEEAVKKNVAIFKERLFGSDSNHKMCVHTRLGDFIPLGSQSRKEYTEYAINKTFHMQRAKHGRVSLVLLGKDREFIDSLKYDRELISHVYTPPVLSRGEDLCFSTSYCDSLLITNKYSTYSWWLAYLMGEGADIYYEPPLDEQYYAPFQKANYLPQWTPIKHLH